MKETKKECFGKNYIDCEEECDDQYDCMLAYQENVAIPRMEKEMTKAKGES